MSQINTKSCIIGAVYKHDSLAGVLSVVIPAKDIAVQDFKRFINDFSRLKDVS